uniref:Uncharacterized protein n=1 Tax=Opuntia streptacantha TaxID=393608 RepID=A0A7C9CY39_OPUST
MNVFIFFENFRNEKGKEAETENEKQREEHTGLSRISHCVYSDNDRVQPLDTYIAVSTTFCANNFCQLIWTAQLLGTNNHVLESSFQCTVPLLLQCCKYGFHQVYFHTPPQVVC